MHFRTRNNVVQVIRTSYDTETKKAKGQIVARMVRAKPEITAAMREALTSAELAEVQAWIESQHRLQQVEDEHAAWTLASQMERAARWLETADAEAARRIASDVQQAWLQVRSAVKRRQLAD